MPEADVRMVEGTYEETGKIVCEPGTSEEVSVDVGFREDLVRRN